MAAAAAGAALSARARYDAAARQSERFMTRQLRPITADDLSALAALHRACFPDDRWDERALAELLAIGGASGHLVEETETREPLGFILDLILAGEAEIFTLCAAPSARRQGIARGLVEHLFARAH